MGVMEHPDFDDHESVVFAGDAESGLRAIIAVHSTILGPSAGGTRFWTYVDSGAALTDALRLSRAMSLKNAMADIPHGGGKGVIMRPEGDFDREAVFRAYGRALNRLGGAYYTAEDVGVSPADMATISAQTDFVAGLDEGAAASGDPSPVTADGIFRGLRVAVKRQIGRNDFKGLRVAVQGLGHVGYALCGHLHRAGAQLIVADIRGDVVDKAVKEFGAEAVAVDAIHTTDCDIFAPCALGGAINTDTVQHIRAQIVGGAANNQLATPSMGDALHKRGIVYCPDYVLNGGGIINVAAELSGRYDPAWVDAKLDALARTLGAVFDAAQDSGRPTHIVAEEMALSRIAAKKPAR